MSTSRLRDHNFARTMCPLKPSFKDQHSCTVVVLDLSRGPLSLRTEPDLRKRNGSGAKEGGILPFEPFRGSTKDYTYTTKIYIFSEKKCSRRCWRVSLYTVLRVTYYPLSPCHFL